MQETQVLSLVQEDPLKNEMATHSSILAWKIQWTEDPGGQMSMGWQRVRHDLVTKQQQSNTQDDLFSFFSPSENPLAFWLPSWLCDIFTQLHPLALFIRSILSQLSTQLPFSVDLHKCFILYILIICQLYELHISSSKLWLLLFFNVLWRMKLLSYHGQTFLSFMICAVNFFQDLIHTYFKAFYIQWRDKTLFSF